MAFELSKAIRLAAHDQAVLETEDYDFDPIGFANSGGCELIVRDDANGHWGAQWVDKQIEMSPRNAIVDVVWQSKRYTIVVAKNQCGHSWFIVGETLTQCEQLFTAVCRWNTNGNNAVTVFDEGYFERDEELREEIKERKLDDLVLQPSVRQRLQSDILEFFRQKEAYEMQGLPWKRGIILHGPPGNGKTQTIRALINEANVATIYVRSLWGYRTPPEKSISRIYERAREIAPCIVVMEDIDSLITQSIRSYFLNELDGIRSMDGVMTIATTNHLENLDIAIRERPSRFDVKIEFANPDSEMRAAYLGEPLFLTKLKPEFATEVIKRTEGMSFAGLQEFVRSTVVLHMRLMDLEKALSTTLDEMVGKPSKSKKDKKKKKSDSK